MRNVQLYILSTILVFVTSCVHVYKDGKEYYSIEEVTRVSKTIGLNGVPKEETHHEYYMMNKGKQSAIVIGYVEGVKRTVTLYITENSSVKRDQTFPIDDKMEVYLLDYVMREIKSKNDLLDITRVQLSMKTCGVASLNFSKNYWRTRSIDSFFQQSLLYQIKNVLKENGYEVYEATKNDFYPIAARKMSYYHLLPDTCSQNATGIDGIVTLKCKKITHP